MINKYEIYRDINNELLMMSFNEYDFRIWIQLSHFWLFIYFFCFLIDEFN